MRKFLAALFMSLVMVSGAHGQTLGNKPIECKEFDLGVHGVNFSVRDFKDEEHLMVYDPQYRTAILVDVCSGWGQMIVGFSAGIPPDNRGPITFDGVDHIRGNRFAWWHRGAVWSHEWPEQWPWQDLKQIVINGVPLFRWR